MYRRPVEDIASEVVSEYLKSKKRHLIITGSVGIGKSTLVEYLVGGQNVYGLRTQAVRQTRSDCPEKIIMEPWQKGNQWDIGIPVSGRCAPVVEGFKKGCLLIFELMASKCEWVIIDEIGFMETEVQDYCDALLKLFQSKNVLAVMRKACLPFLDSLSSREDVYLADLDKIGRI